METYERVPWQTVKRSGLDNLITKLLKKGMSKRKHGSGIARTVSIGMSQRPASPHQP